MITIINDDKYIAMKIKDFIEIEMDITDIKIVSSYNEIVNYKYEEEDFVLIDYHLYDGNGTNNTGVFDLKLNGLNIAENIKKFFPLSKLILLTNDLTIKTKIENINFKLVLDGKTKIEFIETLYEEKMFDLIKKNILQEN